MTSIELAKSIYEKAQSNNKQAWLSEAQNRYIFSLLDKEGRLSIKDTKHYIATILPTGEWINDLTFGEAIEIGKTHNVDSYNLKRVYIVNPPFYIKREGFRAQKITII